VVTERTPSINAGLLASTVTPGNTAPEVSLTTPANALCARAVVGIANRHASANTDIKIRLLVMPIPSMAVADR
jgi:hypothetical protein